MAYYTATTLRTAVATALDNTTKYPDAFLTELIAEFKAVVESPEAFAVAFESTSATETIMTRPGPLLLAHPRVTAVGAFAYTDGLGPAFTIADDLDFTSGYSVIPKVGGRAWSIGREVTITYTHGYVTPPAGILRACRLYVKNEAQAEKSAMPASASSVDSDATGYGYQFERVDHAAGKHTRWPNVNAALAAVTSYRIPGIA